MVRVGNYALASARLKLTVNLPLSEYLTLSSSSLDAFFSAIKKIKNERKKKQKERKKETTKVIKRERNKQRKKKKKRLRNVGLCRCLGGNKRQM